MSLRIDAPAGAAGPDVAGFTAGALLCSRYRLKRVVGSGGMATVWRAHDEHLGRPVAVKVMSDALAADPGYVARFEREARTAASVWHANLVQIYDYSAAGGRPFLVMEYLAGGTLEQRLERGPLTPEELRELAEELLAAIACVHRSGVLHRDIKPANVLLDGAGRARLTDFGIARLQDDTGLTLPGQVVGTLRFLAPELIQGARASRRSDLYALGVVLDLVPVAGPRPAALSELIEQMRDPVPERRPRDAEEALSRLRTTGADGPPTQEFDPIPAEAAVAQLPPPPPLANPVIARQGGSLMRRGLAVATAGLALVLVVLGLSGTGHAVRTASHTRVRTHPPLHRTSARTRPKPAAQKPAAAPLPAKPPGPGKAKGPGHGKGHDGGPPPGHKGHGGGPED
jgi:serine/threonine protein kinase